MSFSDVPLLEAAGDEGPYTNSLRNLKIVRTYTRAFFDKALLGRKDTAVRVKDFPPR